MDILITDNGDGGDVVIREQITGGGNDAISQELITNGNFSDGDTGWTFIQDSGSPAASWGVVSGEGAFVQTAWSSPPSQWEDVGVITHADYRFSMGAGKLYKLKIWMKTEDVGGLFHMAVWGLVQGNLTLAYSEAFTQSSGDWQEVQFDFVPPYSLTDAYVGFFPDRDLNGGSTWIDLISLRVIPSTTNADLFPDLGIGTAVYMSLFDAPAWNESFKLLNERVDSIGLLEKAFNEPIISGTMSKIQRIASSQLKWLLDDGVCSQLMVAVRNPELGLIEIDITATEPNDVQNRYKVMWNREEQKLMSFVRTPTRNSVVI